MVVIEPENCEFVASDGYRLHWQRWPARGETPVAWIVALHGIQSHAGWYEYSSRRLAEAGFEVCFLDRRGSGRNEIARGDVLHEDRLINDVVQFLADVRHRRNIESPASPVVLMSVSWGGKLAAVTTARRPELVDALALLYPGIRAQVRPGWWARFRLGLARRLGVVDRLVDIPLEDPALFTSSEKWQQFIREDRATLRQLTVSFLLANRRLDQLSQDAPARVHCPVLMMLAGKDKIIDNPATRELFDEFVSPRKRLFEYPEADHTLEFEPGRDGFVDDLVGWLGDVVVAC